MTNVADGSRFACWTVDWSSTVGICFKALLRSARHGAFRKSCLLSLDRFEPGDMSRDTLGWFLHVGNGVYEHFSELPAGRTSLAAGTAQRERWCERSASARSREDHAH